MKTRLTVALVGSVVVAAFAIYWPLRGVDSRFAGECRALPVEAGVAGMSVDGGRGVVYVAYVEGGESRGEKASGKRALGTVMLVDLNASEPRVRAALASDPAGFRPGAVSLFVSPEGVRRLFVINRGVEGASSVEIFTQGSTGAFALAKTVQDSALGNASSLVAVGDEQFYFTTESSSTGVFAQLRELLIRPASSVVNFYDGQKVTAAAAGLQGASGLARSADGSLIYVSERTGKRLRVFQRNEATGALLARGSVALGAAPSGLSLDEKGHVWIASQPRKLASVLRGVDSSTHEPTQVINYSPSAAEGARVAEIYVNDGSQLSGGTAVVAHGKRLLIGSAAHHQLLLCESRQR